MRSDSTRNLGSRSCRLLPLLLVVLAGQAAGDERVTVTILATTDVHGYIYPYDYLTGRPAPRGLAAASTLIEQVRRETPDTILIDCGDTIQGSPLESVQQSAVRAGKPVGLDPMMLAMNAMRYDAMVVGNHEYNFGLRNLSAAREAARFPWLSANTRTTGVIPELAPYFRTTVAGVRIAVIGVTTAAIPVWEKPEQIAGLSWMAPEEGVRRALERLDGDRPDAVIAAVHGGLDRDLLTGTLRAGEMREDNRVWQIAESFPNLAAIVYGHTHQRQPGYRVGNVLLVQPRNWAMDVARIDLSFSREPGGSWRLTSSKSTLMPVTPETPPDPEILEIARPYHEAAERYLDQPVTDAATDLSGSRGRFEDSAVVDAIHEVQLFYTKAQVSFTALFRPQVLIRHGPVTVRQLAGLYTYDNELYAVEGTGRMVREALENAARYFRTCPEPTCSKGPLLDPSVMGYNFDTAQGVEYEIDLNRPAGRRVVDLRYRGAPLADDQPLRIALNNYRAAGSGGYAMFRNARIVWRSGREIRDLMVDYYGEHRRLPEKPDGNWHIVPERAVATLVLEDSTPR